MLRGLAAVFALVLFGCSDANDTPPDGMGRLVVRLTDAPFPFDWVEAAHVTVFKVEVRLKDGEDSMESVGGSPYVLLMEEEVDVNLLELTNGLTETLVDIDVPAGTYDQVRVHVRGIEVVLTDGRTFPLEVPSGEQTGIKVFVTPGITVAGGLTADLLLDFDVSRSFVPRGNLDSQAGINGFNFKPVIKAVNASTAGTLAGRVTYFDEMEAEMPLEGATVSVWDGETEVATGFTDADGNYAFPGIAAGTYTVKAEAMDYLPSEPAEVSIVIANRTTQDFVLEADPEAATETETETGG